MKEIELRALVALLESKTTAGKMRADILEEIWDELLGRGIVGNPLPANIPTEQK